MSPVNYTFGPPGLNNLACQWFSNLHCKSGVLPVISERMGFLLAEHIGLYASTSFKTFSISSYSHRILIINIFDIKTFS